MLSFELIKPANATAIQVCCDEEGLEELISALQRLKHQGHVHLCSPLAGGKILSDQTIHGKDAIGEVIVTLI
ncbi:MAG: hypothetical protein K0R10_1641 [Alphaproteobacteria bacterium]|jgi:hypothetical protein|nr:hypothetical protein [Alphaproteobacteria bacterium]